MKKAFTLLSAILVISILSVGLLHMDVGAVTNYASRESGGDACTSSVQVAPTDNDYFDDYDGPQYVFTLNANGGTLSEGVEPICGLLMCDEIMTFPDYCFRDGYYCIGWTVRRDTDRKWYVDGKGWVSEDQLASSDQKTVFENYEIICIDDEWTDGLPGGGSYTFYAVWKEGEVARGDVNVDGDVDMDDAIRLLFAINFPVFYPIDQPADVDGNGKEDMDDAVYLLFHVNFPESYPLH